MKENRVKMNNFFRRCEHWTL